MKYFLSILAWEKAKKQFNKDKSEKNRLVLELKDSVMIGRSIDLFDNVTEQELNIIPDIKIRNATLDSYKDYHKAKKSYGK